MIIDISSNQGIVDFAKLKAAEVTDVIIRVSMGYNTKDKMADIYAKGAQAQGLNIWYYHFCYPDHKVGDTVTADATAEATWFLKCIKTMPAYKRLMADFEQESLLNKNDYLTWMETCLNIIDTVTPEGCIVYTYADYLNRHLPSNHPFGKRDLHIANYSAKANPPLPIGWTKWFIWQYDNKGKIDGIKTTVDLNKLNN